MCNITALRPRNTSKLCKVKYSCPSIMIQLNEKLAFYNAILIIFLLQGFRISHSVLLMSSQSLYPSLNCPLFFLSPITFHVMQSFRLLFSELYFSGLFSPLNYLEGKVLHTDGFWYKWTRWWKAPKRSLNISLSLCFSIFFLYSFPCWLWKLWDLVWTIRT